MEVVVSNKNVPPCSPAALWIVSVCERKLLQKKKFKIGPLIENKVKLWQFFSLIYLTIFKQILILKLTANVNNFEGKSWTWVT